MLARNDLEVYVTDNYGTCTRPPTSAGENACYWGRDRHGNWNGCLRAGWRGIACPYWQPAEGQARADILSALSLKSLAERDGR